MSADTKPFLTATFRGERFNKNSLPIDALLEVVAYRDLVLEATRHLFFRNNPRRQRLPSGFQESFDLHLTEIGKGSAIANLVRVEGLAPTLPGFLDEFDSARDLLNRTIETVSKGEPLPERFPKEILPLFERFGLRLRHDEVIALGVSQQQEVIYNQEVRKKLVLLHSSRYLAEFSIAGRVCEIDRRTHTFQIQVAGGRIVTLPYPKQKFTSMFGAFRDMARVRVSGLGYHDPRDRFLSAEEEQVTINFAEEFVSPRTALQDRIAELRDMPAGWFDGEGESLDPAGLTWAEEMLSELAYGNDISQPYIYPTPEGNLQAEWSSGDWEVRLLFTLLSQCQISFLAVNVKTREELDREFKWPEEMGDIVSTLKPILNPTEES